MADTDFSSAPKDSSSTPKPLIYDLLNRLNASFARVHRNMEALEAVGIFDPLMMQNLNRQSEQLRAGANYHLLGAMRRVEERDRERFSQPPNAGNCKSLNKEPASKKAGLRACLERVEVQIREHPRKSAVSFAFISLVFLRVSVPQW